MKVCVVGGTGTISGPIVQRLIELDHEVVVFNRGQRHAPPTGCRVISGDRQDRSAFEAAMQAENFDAAIDMISFSAADAASSLRAFANVDHFIHCSSCVVYGLEHHWMPLSEEHPFGQPPNDYGRGKLEAENVLWAAYYEQNFPLTVMRPAATYGLASGVARQLCRDYQAWLSRIRLGKPVLICGDGNTLFQFLHADDAGPAFAHALGRPRCIGQAYHVVRDEAITWAEHHRTAMRALDNDVELVGLPRDMLERLDVPGKDVCLQNFAHHSWFDNRRIRRDVPEFNPQITLEDGMIEVIAEQDRLGHIAAADTTGWEDDLIQRLREIR